MGDRPHYEVGAVDKVSGKKASRVGAAWRNDNGTITVRLNPFIQLPATGEVVLTLFPVEQRQPLPTGPGPRAQRQLDLPADPPRGAPATFDPDFDDEIPF